MAERTLCSLAVRGSEEKFTESLSLDHRWDWPGSKSSAEKQSTLVLGECVCLGIICETHVFFYETHLEKKSSFKTVLD